MIIFIGKNSAEDDQEWSRWFYFLFYFMFYIVFYFATNSDSVLFSDSGSAAVVERGARAEPDQKVHGKHGAQDLRDDGRPVRFVQLRRTAPVLRRVAFCFSVTSDFWLRVSFFKFSRDSLMAVTHHLTESTCPTTHATLKSTCPNHACLWPYLGGFGRRSPRGSDV